MKELYPAIVRDKVTDLMSTLNNNDNATNNRVKGGSGRILRKAFSSFSAHSRSFDESTVETNCDTNNNRGFRRSTSTICLDTLRGHHMKLMAAREA